MEMVARAPAEAATAAAEMETRAGEQTPEEAVMAVETTASAVGAKDGVVTEVGLVAVAAKEVETMAEEVTVVVVTVVVMAWEGTLAVRLAVAVGAAR